MCTFGKTYNRYQPGAFQLPCSGGKLQLKEFPQDHLKDIMESFQMQDDTSLHLQVIRVAGGDRLNLQAPDCELSNLADDM